jgi:hypothetical protein
VDIVKRPAFMFYPADWRGNAKLRRCSEAARGAWMDVLCLLHDSDEYGVIRWPLADLARAAGVPVKLLDELVKKDVLKGADGAHEAYVYTPRHAGRDGEPVELIPASSGPCWYSTRLVRDEWVRQRRGGSTRFHEPEGAPESPTKRTPKAAPKSTPNPPIGDGLGDGPSVSSSVSEYPHTPKGASATSLTTWLERVRADGKKPIPDDDPVFDYIASAGIPDTFLRLAWLEFKDRHSAPGAKRYKDWPATFRNAVRGNWYRLWRADGNEGYVLTSDGVQAQRVHEERRAA